MIRLSRTIHFNAGRSLWRPEWTAEKNTSVYGVESPHGYGHNYELELAVEGKVDPETSMVVNLTDLDRILKEEVDRPLDHKNLNRDVPDFAKTPPTAENLAAWIWKRVAARIEREKWPCRVVHLRLRLAPALRGRDRGIGASMGPVLVVGATGQLGTAVVDRLRQGGQRVRALVRAGSPREFESEGVELAFGDLREPESLVAACQGMATVVSTANAVVPRDKATFAQVEETGYDNLLDACRAENVRRFIFMSVVPTPHDKSVTTFRLKRRIEERIQGSGLAYSIFRGDFFMDDWFALMGSAIPLRGAKAHTLRRPFWFAKGFMRFAGSSIDKRGIALVPGDGRSRHTPVALDDVAAILAAAASEPETGESANLVENLGGPEILSWHDVVAIFSRVLGRPLKMMHTPAKVYRVAADVLEALSPPAGNLMAMSWVASMSDTAFDGKPLAERFGVKLTTAEQFLRAKAALPPEA